MTIREIPGFPGYSISECGRVFSVRSCGNGAKNGTRPIHELRTKPYGAGYVGVGLGRGCTQYVQRLVAYAFHGPPPAGFEACHIDGNKLNNHASNIRRGSRQDNMRDNIAQGKTQPGSKNALAKLNEGQVFQIKEMLGSREYSHREIALRFGVSTTVISLIAIKKTWRHVPDPEGFGRRRRGGANGRQEHADRSDESKGHAGSQPTGEG